MKRYQLMEPLAKKIISKLALMEVITMTHQEK